MSIEQRAKNRQLVRDREAECIFSVIKKGITFFQDYENCSEEMYKKQKRETLEYIKNNFTHDGYINAQHIIRDLVIEGNSSLKWAIAVPRKITNIVKIPHFRKLDWFLECNEFSKWVECWEKDVFNYFPDQEVQPDQILASILISSICFGGLNSADYVYSLANKLTSSLDPLFVFSNITWIDLELDPKDKGFLANTVIKATGDKAPTKVCIKRFYPDSFTLMLINQYLIKRKCGRQINKNVTKKLIKDCLINIADNNEFDINDFKKLKIFRKLEDLCSVAIGITERLPGVKYNQTLINYSLGKLHSASLPPENLEAIFTHKYPPVINDLEIIEINDEDDELILKEHTTNRPRSSSSLFAALKKIVYTKSGDKKKYPNKVIDKLYDLIVNEERCHFFLIRWLIYLLEERGNAVSTINSYVSSLGEAWFTATESDINFYNKNDLENTFETIINYKEESKQYRTERLRDLHYFSRMNYELPDVDVFPKKMKKDKYVRSGYIGEELFKSFLNKLDDYIIHDNEIMMMKCYFIIAYRTGLRSEEIRKLKVRDIEATNDMWVFVRKNRYGNNKSGSASRKLPLSILLLENEEALVRTYIKIKTTKHDVNHKSFLFSFDLNTKRPISKGYEHRLFRTFISETTQLKLVFHHFRHTALSNLHVILSNNNTLITSLLSYSEIHIRKIQNYFNYTSKNVYWSLAMFAGHMDPSQTFRTYLRFTDYLSFGELNNRIMTINSKQLMAVSGLSSQYISSHLKSLKLDNNKIIYKSIPSILKNSLAKYSYVIQNNNSEILHIDSNPNIYNSTPEVCHQILQQIENEISTAELSLEYLLDESEVKEWLKSARYLSKLKIRKFSHQFFKKLKKVPKIGYHLAPTKPRSNAELNNCKRILDKCFVLLNDDPALFKEPLAYFQENYRASSNSIIFSNPSDLESYLLLLNKFLRRKQIEIIHTPQKDLNNRKQEKAWKAVILKKGVFIANTEKTVNQRNKFPLGKVELKIPHPDEDKLISKGHKKNKNYSEYTTNMVNFVFHLLLIMNKKKLDI